ncbi:MAG: type II toxin-antitoxin system RelE/ParE family toxin [Clostridiales Family XIII bacterium]|jgi:plasmid stabilization system protein ParE|nr:type II toxin-antitoxin system RelE/ParE family toxin [Clostridiales Family XIII bacterium]
MTSDRYTIKVLPPAKREIEEIAYVYFALSGPEAAKKITDRLRGSIESLADNPKLGLVCKDKVLRIAGYRMLIVGNHLCFYRLIGECVFISHIADSRTDYPRIFNEYNETQD